jgi:hypothetical protein
VKNSPHDLTTTSPSLSFIEKDQNQDLQENDAVLPTPGLLGFSILPVKKQGVAKLVIPPLRGVMGGMNFFPQETTLLETSHAMKHFRRRHLDNMITERP